MISFDNWYHITYNGFPILERNVGRRSKKPTSQVKARVPEELARNVRILLTDPATGQVEHGKLSALITSLLQEWVNDKRKTSDD